MKQHENINFPVPEVDTSNLELYANALKVGIPDISKSFLESMQIGCDIIQKFRPGLDYLTSECIKTIDTMPYIQPILTGLLDLTDRLSQVLSKLYIPEVSSNRREELLESHRQWGRYGWTLHPHASLKCFYEKPLNIKDAHKQMQEFLSKVDTEYVFAQLKKETPNSKELDSAIFCYENRQYKACALLLFSMIDSMMVRSQKGVMHRDVGKRAVNYIRDKVEDSNEQTLLFILHQANIISCLETFFESGHDFIKEPITINRNYISHGMNRHPVRKRDCYQLFLLLHNYIWFSNRWFHSE